MMRSIFRGMLGVLLFIGTCFSGADARSYRIATVAWIGWSPLHVAAANGFWKDQGLDVAVVNYDDPIVILEAIKAGKIDFAMDMAGSLVGVYMQGEPVAAIAETNWSHGGDKIVVRRGTRLKDHRGEVLGVFLKQPSCLFFLDQYLQKIHLGLSDFRLVEINPRDLSAQFVAGRLSAIVNYEPWVNEAVNEGNGTVLATSADFAGCIPECLWGYRAVIRNMPVTDVCKVINGWIRAVHWSQNPANRETYFSILKDRTFASETGLKQEDLSNMLDNVAIHNPRMLYARNRTGGGLFRYLQAVKAFLQRNGMLRRDFSPGDIFDNRFILRVLKTGSPPVSDR